MHVCFIPYGKKEWVDIFLRDIAAQKLPMRIYKKGEEDQQVMIECQLRVLPFGFYEFVFPKEHLDVVLTSFKFHKPSYNDLLTKDLKLLGLKFKPLDKIRKILKLQEAPKKFKTDKTLFWNDVFVSIIPVGIRYDGEVEEANGWKHEAV